MLFMIESKSERLWKHQLKTKKNNTIIMSKDTTIQLKILKLNQMRLLTDLMGQINELKYSSTEAGVQSKCNDIDALLQEKIAELNKL